MEARQKTGDTGKVQTDPERANGRAVFESSFLLELGAGGLQELRERLGEHWQGSEGRLCPLRNVTQKQRRPQVCLWGLVCQELLGREEKGVTQA